MVSHKAPQTSTTSTEKRRRNIFVSSLAFRLLIAFAISWLIVLAFFVSGVASH